MKFIKKKIILMNLILFKCTCITILFLLNSQLNNSELGKAQPQLVLIYGQGAEILAFFPMTMARTPPPEVQKTQWSYFGSWPTNQKTKDTFFSSTFKVSESKVSLFFLFMALGPRYWDFFRLTIPCALLSILKQGVPGGSTSSALSASKFCTVASNSYQKFVFFGPPYCIISTIQFLIERCNYSI